jgi:hypothetical protein
VVFAWDMIGLGARFADNMAVSVAQRSAEPALLDRLDVITSADATEPGAIAKAMMPSRSFYYGTIRHSEPLLHATARLQHIPIFDSTASDGGRQYAVLGASLPIPKGSKTRPAPDTNFAATVPRVSVPATHPITPEATNAKDRRWSGSAWAFWRDGGKDGASYGSAGQLGGSQAGVRLERRFTETGKLASVSAYGRATAALSAPHMPEMAVGIALRPVSTKLPVMIAFERRVALDSDARNAFAVFAAGGLNPTEIAPGLIAQGYAQAGVVGFSRRDLFTDGRVSLGRRLDRQSRVVAGASLSGGAQPGVSRMDAGPMIEMRLPIKNNTTRFVVEWRQRIAGKARPGSGLSMTFASDF